MSRNKKMLLLFLVVAVAVLGIAGVILQLALPSSAVPGVGAFGKVDSGVVACKTIKDNITKPDHSDHSKMTVAQRDALIKPFAESKYADIKVAGTNVINTVYSANNLKDDDLGGAMALLTSIQSQWTALQTACLNHGVEIPALPMS